MADATLDSFGSRSAAPHGPRLRDVPVRLWRALPAAGRFALLGVLTSALVAVALGLFIPLEVRRHLLSANARGLEAAVLALGPSMPDVRRGPPPPEQAAVFHRLVDRALLDANHVRVKLWSLDGQLLYSDASANVGHVYPDVVPRVRAAAERGVLAEVSDLGDPENESEQGYSRLVEYYVPVRDDAGRAIAVFEIYEDVRLFEEALAGITTATWLAIGSGLAILMVFLSILVLAAIRSIERDRAAAEARSAELSVLADAAGALVSSLEPSELIAHLDARVRRALRLSRFAIERERPGPKTPDVLAFPLRDGSWLVTGRADEPLTGEDARVLRSVANTLDAALANAALFAEVRDAGLARRTLLRKVDEAHEDERRHLVGELHDSLAADLIRILYGVRGIASRAELLSDEIRQEVAALEGLAGRAEEDLRAFMGRVRPSAVDDIGLAAALEAAVGRFRTEGHLAAELRVRGAVGSVPPELQLLVLRAVEEALLNVRKHATARRVRVNVHADRRHVRLTVDDDGVGWHATPADQGGRQLGLAYLRERVGGFGGVVRTEQSRLGGARLSLTVPVEA